MKKFNNFSILRNGKIFLLALAAWLTMSTSWAQESESTDSGYLGFTATASGTTTVKLNKKNNPNSISLQYRINEGNWTNYTIGNDINLSQGQKVEFKASGKNGKNSTFSNSFGYNQDNSLFGTAESLNGNFYYFSFSNKVESFGNVSSLLQDPEQGTITSLPNYAFAGLFQNCTNLLSAPNLPSSSVALGEYCYAGMFFQCLSLQSAPDLPATTLKNYCYTYMFAGCEKLQSINVGFTSWHANATTNWVRSTYKNFWRANFLGGPYTNLYHQFSATGGTFYGNVSYESNDSRIPTGWIVPTDKDYLLFSWNSAIATPNFWENLGTFLGLGNDNPKDIYVTIKLNPSDNLKTNGTTRNLYCDDRPLQYSKSGASSDWDDWSYSSGTSIKLKFGESCFIRAKKANPDYSSFTIKNSATNYFYFTITPSNDAQTSLKDNITGDGSGIICVTGNIMSLLDRNCTSNTVPEYGFYKLFNNPDGKGDVCIFNAPILPATDLNAHCYEGMFQGCTKLNAAPNLPATTEQLEDNYATDCYKNMFNGCSNINYIKVGFDKWNMTNYESSDSENVEPITHNFTITNNWVAGVTKSPGTFKCPEGLDITYDDSHIPTAWNNSSSNVGTTEEKEDWLCFELTSSYGTVRLNKVGDISTLTGKLEYSTDEGASWNTYTWSDKFGYEIPLNVKKGVHRVYFRSKLTDDSGRCSTSGSTYYQFQLEGNYDVSGNIMSLLHRDCERFDVQNYEFFRLFRACKTIRTAPSLPATSLAAACYFRMFESCSSLLSTPDLPAEILKAQCYRNMFSSCTSLTSTTQLPATTLASTCYYEMFKGCTSITVAPTLPAVQLAYNCYYGMFNGCSSLNSMDVSFTEWRDDLTATDDWVNDVADEGIFWCPSALDTTQFNPNRVPKTVEKKWKPVVNANTYLYFESKKNGSSVKLSKTGSPNPVYLLYSINNGQNWEDYTIESTIVLDKGKRVYFKAGKKSDESYKTNNSFSKDADNYYKFIMKGNINAKGNTMSLLNQDNDDVSLQEYTFCYLFVGCTSLYTAPSLPAKNLNKACYYRMFQGCKNLLTPPAVLPAEELKQYCYAGMFRNCSNLQTAPKIEATKLANSCCAWMFANCTSLTVAPSLPVTQLETQCYRSMFQGCSSLKYMNVGFKNWHANATNEWVKDSILTNGTTYSFPTQGIFICPEELPHAENQGYFGANRIPKADEVGKRWNVNVVALQFVANQDNVLIALNKVGTPTDVTLEYSTNNAQSWNPYTFGDVIRLKENESFFIRSTSSNTTGFSKDASNYYQFSITGSTSVVGSISSLLNKDANDATTLQNYCFYNLFKDCEGLTNMPELPATTLGNYAYQNMFYNTGITEADELIATTLGTGCYQGMFQNCLALRKAPELNAETLSSNCYNSMFTNCSSLMEGPVLNATALAAACYQNMFKGCTNLRIAPYLPATTLVSNCYAGMFSGCSMLCEISVEFSAWSPNNATSNWVKDVSDEGIFSCPNGLNTNTFGASNVPKDNNHEWDINPDFLGFKAITDATIALNKVGTPHAAYLIYSVNSKSKWKSYSWDGQNGLTIELHAGESVYFKAENDYNVAETTDENNPVPNKLSKDADNYYQFSITGAVAASGKASFLLSRTKNSEEVPAYGFYRLFKDCTGLTTAPGVAICDKANAHSYESMFEGCSNITSGPTSLPATTVGTASFKNMFKGCEKLTTSPAALPATSVAESCYESMFEGDSLITRIPTLGVSTNTAKAAYKNMFKGCKSLTSDNMPSQLMDYDWRSISESVYEGMFEGCSSLTEANINLLTKGLDKACYKNMFKGCSSLVTTMASLPTPNNITESCYEGMFEGCENITTAPNVAWTSNPAKASFKAMFKGCKALVNNLPEFLGNNQVIKESCYESLFEGCESMNTKINLPSKGLEKAVFKAMFKDCKSLTSDNLPELGFENWAIANGESALESMFEGCESLTTPVVIRDVANWSQYPKAIMRKMFKGCTNLTTPLTLPLAAIGEACFESMFEGCESLTKAPQLPQTNLAKDCYKRMFMDCTSLKRAPQLPAKTGQLQDSCYAYMFNGCTSLRYIDVAFNKWFDEQGANFDAATYMWVENVAPTGTFMCPFELDKTKVDASHIPSGWSTEDNGNYLYIAKVEGGNFDVYLNKQGNPNDINYQFSLDKKTWTSFSTDIWNNNKILTGDNTIVYIKCAEGVMSKDANNYWFFSTTGNVKIGGNITSLLDPTMEQTDVPDYAFYKLFSGCQNITDISELELPATELGAYAYAKMFDGCTTLKSTATATPELPATTLGAYCYQNLFEGWTALTKAPELPATTLEEGCYSGLFKGCTSLTTAPLLPATTVVNNCYDSMFDGCSSLNKLTVAFTAWVEGATDNWVSGVAADGVFTCPWALANDAINKHNQKIAQAYGSSWIPKDASNPWMILLQTGIEFNYRTGNLTFTGQSPITYTTDNTLSIDNRIGETVNQKSVTINLSDWLNESITQFDSITYYALAGEALGEKVQPTVNSFTIYRHPKKIDMCICDTRKDIEDALYYANKVSSADYPIKLFIGDGEYDFGNKTLVVGDYVSVIGESINGTILKSSSDNGIFNIKGNDAYLQDMKLINTGSGAAFTNKGQRTTLHVDMEGYYIEGGMTKHNLPEAWNRATDPTQATITSASVNGSTISLTSDAKYFLVRIDEKYSFANSKDFYIVESLAGKNVTVRAANNRGAFGEPITPNLIEPNGSKSDEFSVKLNGYGYSSFCFDDDNIDQLQVIGASVYKGIYRDGAVYLIRLNEHDIVPKRTGVILAGLQNSTVSFYENNSVVLSDEERNPYNYLPDEKCIGMSGNWSTETIVNNGHNYYVLSNNYGGFKPLKKDGGTIKPNKAYFDLGNSTNAATVRIVFGMWEDEEEEVVSGINYLPTTSNDSEYGYTLTGVRTKDAKGLVIQNNKVVLVK